MGEYAKTHKRIYDLEQRKKALKDKIAEMLEQVADIEEEIADLYGYLQELASIDNCDIYGN